MFLFLLNTPTQLLNAIALIYGRFADVQCDAYYTENLKPFFENEWIHKIFASAYPVKLLPEICKRNSNLKKNIVRIKNGLDFRKVKKTLPSDPNSYDRIFASGISLRNYEIYYAIKAANQKACLSIFEEGMCEYYYYGREKDKSHALFSHFFFGRYYIEEADSLYVYHPDAVICNWDNLEIKPIPKIEEPELIEIINHVFRYEPTDLRNAKNKVVILEQAFYEDADIARQNEIIDRIGKAFGPENVVIKLHPRSPLDKYQGKFPCCKTTIPLELIVLNEDIMNNVFVSISSSAVLNFKLMFDMEPNIIVLNRMDRETTDVSDMLFDYVKNNSRRHNFWIPGNMAELGKIIEEIVNANG